MPRQLTNRSFDLRLWQQEAFRTLLEAANNKRDFLCVATPGSGKTKFALTTAHHFLKEKYCERVVVITPTDHLKKQWAEEAAVFAGIDLDPHFKNSMASEAPDYHGVVITYALLGQDKQKVQVQNTFRKKTFVIFDEIHHAGDDLTWGNAIREGFENAIFRLAISGTAFRSDDNPIPFITYQDRVSVPDYNYPYERAIKENVCRPVYFCIYNGMMKWKVSEKEFEHSFKDSLAPDQVSKRLKTALDPKGNWIRNVIMAADEKLTEIRRVHHTAAALVFASTQKHAKELSKVIKEMTGVNPPVVVSEEDENTKKIDEFKNGSARWLVSVKMISEGVDIPRLRVGVYFTIIKTEMYFRQTVGRFVRILKNLSQQEAFIFIPQDRDIVRLAESIQEERDHALDEAERAASIGQTDLFGADYVPALRGKFVPIGSEATDSKIIAVNVELSSGARHSVDTRKPLNENPVFMQKHNLRIRINKLAKVYALKKRNSNTNIKPDWHAAHKEYLKEGGKNIEFETIEELQRRIKFYEQLINNYKN